MSLAGQPWHPRGLDHAAQQRLTDDAQQAGITRVQVQALVHRHELLLLVSAPDDHAWAVPVAAVHTGETISDAVDRLCSHLLGLPRWDAAFAATTVCPMPGGRDVLQVAFRVTFAPKTRSPWTGRRYWWHTHTPPPALHPLSRPVLEQLYPLPPHA